jgi:hypothetical protein
MYCLVHEDKITTFLFISLFLVITISLGICFLITSLLTSIISIRLPHSNNGWADKFDCRARGGGGDDRAVLSRRDAKSHQPNHAKAFTTQLHVLTLMVTVSGCLVERVAQVGVVFVVVDKIV